MASPTDFCKGIVKQVLSGDAVIIRGQPKRGPPPEVQLNFSNVIAPKLARRATASQPETVDEPYAWESREFLRKKVIGKDVLFTTETETQTGRKYGCLHLGKDIATAINVTEMMVSEGLLTVRKENMRGESPLLQLEENAKAQKKGLHEGDDDDHVRKIEWTIENLRSFVADNKGKLIKGVIEHVRDGSTVRAFLLPSFQHITLMISGIRCPMFKVDSDGRPDKANAEPFAEEARYFVESRLLQRDLEIIIESCNNNNVVGTIKHPNGNIAELLLKEGFAKCIGWSMATVTGGGEKLHKAEQEAKKKNLKIWLDFKPAADTVSGKDREISGIVSEVSNGDSVMIKKSNGQFKKIFLASIRPPRLADPETQRNSGKAFRALYDIPWLFEARELLRKKLIGEKIQATIDYIQPPQNNFPEKVCCTIKIGNVNVAEELVENGLATVVRYRQDDDQRANCYDDLLTAEAEAIKENRGVHDKKDIPFHRVVDLAGDATKAKNFLPRLKRIGTVDAVVEFVASGSRVRLYIPKETALITFLLSGISCPKPTRPSPGGPGAGVIPGEAYGAEAQALTKDLIMQRGVQVEVETMDKGGNFIGWLHINGKNLSVCLVEDGLSSVHNTAESSRYYMHLKAAETKAKKKKLNIWANFVEVPIEEKVEDILLERKIDYKPMRISEVTRDGKLFGQYSSDGPALESMMEELKQAFVQTPPVIGSYSPMKGDVCAAKFADDCWYRAKVERVSGGQVSILYIDYGNREITKAAKCAQLPPRFTRYSNYAKEMCLAFVKFHKDEDYIEDAVTGIINEVIDKELIVNIEYKVSPLDYVSIKNSDTKEDLAMSLVSQGLVLVDRRRDKRFQTLMTEYCLAQDEAKKKHRNIWQYGDVTEDDAFEFGMER